MSWYRTLSQYRGSVFRVAWPQGPHKLAEQLSPTTLSVSTVSFDVVPFSHGPMLRYRTGRAELTVRFHDDAASWRVTQDPERKVQKTLLDGLFFLDEPRQVGSGTVADSGSLGMALFSLAMMAEAFS